MKNIITVKSPTKTELLTLRLMIFLGLAAMWLFLKTVFSAEIRANGPLYYLLMVTFVFNCATILHEWLHYFYMTVPETPPGTKAYTVDIFTTFVAGEPYAMIEETLTALQAVSYPHKTYLCDESNDPRLKAFCEKLGVYHVTRADKRDAKAGNINNALRQSDGELCVVLDPDHVPFPGFLDPIVSHFDNPEIGFVQIVQAYSNHKESLIAKGAAQQTYQFYGPMMMTMNKYGTVQAIGANCTFRRAALESIGGHAAGLAEDMHTSMRLHAKGWKSVYLPMVLARGLVPSTLSAYYQQQLKWSRGVFDLAVTAYPKLFSEFTWKQKLHYATIPLHYASGLIFLINFLIPLIALFFNKSPVYMSLSDFGFTLLPLLAAIVLIRHFVQWWVMEDEERGFHVVGGLLMIGTWWIFITGLVYTILRKKVPYVPTPKEGTDDDNWLLNVPNILVFLFSAAAIVYGLANDWNPYNLAMAGFAATNCLFMVFVIAASRQQQLRRWNRPLTAKLFSWIGEAKGNFWIFRRRMYARIRKMALGITAISVALLAYFKTVDTEVPITESRTEMKPANGDGARYKMTPLTLVWGKPGRLASEFNKVDSICASGSLPVLSWKMEDPDSLTDSILAGEYDGYLRQFSEKIRAARRPVYLQSDSGVQSREVRKYLYRFLREQQIYNVIYLDNADRAVGHGGLPTGVSDTLFKEPFNVTESTVPPIFAGLHGVNYSKGQDWVKKRKVFTKAEVEADFAEMKAMHINAIKRYGPGVYDRNVLEEARKNAIQVHYGFWLPENIDFRTDEEILDDLRVTVLNTVEDLKSRGQIRSWNLGNAVFQKLENRFRGPDLLYQQQACLRWLKHLVSEIRHLDPDRPITLDVDGTPETQFVARRIRNFIPGINAFGLVISDSLPPANLFRSIPAPFFISYITPKNEGIVPVGKAFFVSNWQDEIWTDRVSFDGIKDFTGRYKSKSLAYPVKILKPAAGTFANIDLVYHAMIKKGGHWKLASAVNGNLRFEWKLVSTDQYANPLAVTDVGEGPDLVLKIPEHAASCRLYLYVVQGDSVKAIIPSTLNTPLTKAIE